MIAIVDYDAGNLASVIRALQALGKEACITRDPEEIRKADRLILPGVGAFGDACGKLGHYGLTDVLKEYAGSGRPFLGICLGLQLMFESSEESPGVEGLSLLRGKIVRIPPADGLKIPHIGWNSLRINPESRLFSGISPESHVYFVHSFYLQAENPSDVAATTEYGVSIDAAVEKDNLFACQFHPEKSGAVGLKLLENFASL